MYKLPKITDSNNELVKAGVAYYYFDPSVQTGRLSTVGIDSPKQAVAKTLNQIYSNHKSKNVAYLMYSDQWPNTKDSKGNRGHTKVTALKYNCPAIYDSNVPSVINKVVKGLGDVANGKCQTSREDTHYHADIKTVDGVTLDIFAKSAKFNEDIYSKFLAPHYKTDIYVQTWQQGNRENNYDPFCEDYRVETITSLIFPDDVEFLALNDHSKWAIPTTDSESRICIGDINRQLSQKKRGGGMVCAKLPKVRNTYESFINEIDACDDEHDELCYDIYGDLTERS
ncbi:plancitoxin-1-like [Ptychodera flava]|uniref:plancitoxin-1-like n=1 Tax=Ptychodera flava TaxID=63121 RepID=UPI00396A3B8E